jgi:Na+-transporting methylmalonyl-CoA/oxaloacetate decarboxylase gamma subunit
MSVESEVGAFFEILYQGGAYWKFLGLTQVLAGIFVLIPATSAIGALIFLESC